MNASPPGTRATEALACADPVVRKTQQRLRSLPLRGIKPLMIIAGIWLVCSVLPLMSFAAPTVSFYRVELQPGLNLVGNQLNAGNSFNFIGWIFRTVPEGTKTHKMIDGGEFTTNSFESGEWMILDEPFEVGEGIFMLNPTNEIVKVAISGTVLEGTLTNSLPAGLSIRTGMIPMRNRVTTDLGLKLSPFDNLYLWKDGRLETYTFLPGDRWHPTEPAIELGAAFVLNLAKPLEWVIEFQLNP